MLSSQSQNFGITKNKKSWIGPKLEILPIPLIYGAYYISVRITYQTLNSIPQSTFNRSVFHDHDSRPFLKTPQKKQYVVPNRKECPRCVKTRERHGVSVLASSTSDSPWKPIAARNVHVSHLGSARFRASDRGRYAVLVHFPLSTLREHTLVEVFQEYDVHMTNRPVTEPLSSILLEWSFSECNLLSMTLTTIRSRRIELFFVSGLVLPCHGRDKRGHEFNLELLVTVILNTPRVVVVACYG